MNAAILMMSSALASGGDVVPAGWGEKPLPVVQAGGCCDSGRTKLLDRLKGKFGAKKGPDCCEPSPAPYYQPNLLDKMKDRWGGKKSYGCTDACPAPACGPIYGPAAVPVPHHPPHDVPKDMIDVKPNPEPMKNGGNGGTTAPPVAPSPVPLPLPSAPLSPPKLSGTTSPY